MIPDDALDLGVARSHQAVDTPEVTAPVIQCDGHAVQCRCAQIVEAPAGARPPGGFAHSMTARAAKAVRGVNMLIRALIITAAVISAGETPVRAGPGPQGEEEVPARGLHQPAHLLLPRRPVHGDLRSLRVPGPVRGGQAAEALRALIHASSIARDQGLAAVPADVMALGLKLFRHAVPAGLSQIPRIPPTSNQAERDLRPAKTQQKISGRLRSQARAGNRHAIRGALTGNPWMPPLPA